MSKSWRNRRAAVQPPARRRDELEPVAAAQLLRVHHLAFEELEHERVVLGQRGDDGRADAGLRCGDRVVDLVRAVDREQARVLAGDADDVGAARRRDDLVVRVREAAGERLDLRSPCSSGTSVEDVVERHAPSLRADRDDLIAS